MRRVEESVYDDLEIMSEEMIPLVLKASDSSIDSNRTVLYREDCREVPYRSTNDSTS